MPGPRPEPLPLPRAERPAASLHSYWRIPRRPYSSDTSLPDGSPTRNRRARARPTHGGSRRGLLLRGSRLDKNGIHNPGRVAVCGPAELQPTCVFAAPIVQQVRVLSFDWSDHADTPPRLAHPDALGYRDSGPGRMRTSTGPP